MTQSWKQTLGCLILGAGVTAGYIHREDIREYMKPRSQEIVPTMRSPGDSVLVFYGMSLEVQGYHTIRGPICFTLKEPTCMLEVKCDKDYTALVRQGLSPEGCDLPEGFTGVRMHRRSKGDPPKCPYDPRHGRTRISSSSSVEGATLVEKTSVECEDSVGRKVQHPDVVKNKP